MYSAKTYLFEIVFRLNCAEKAHFEINTIQLSDATRWEYPPASRTFPFPAKVNYVFRTKLDCFRRNGEYNRAGENANRLDWT